MLFICTKWFVSLINSYQDPARHGGAPDPPRASSDRHTEDGEASHQAPAATLPARPVRAPPAAALRRRAGRRYVHVPVSSYKGSFWS